MTLRRTITRPSWKIRRRIIVATLLFCAFEVIWMTFWGQDTQLSNNIILGCFALAGSTIGSYVFGAVWDDSNTNRIDAELNQPCQKRESPE